MTGKCNGPKKIKCTCFSSPLQNGFTRKKECFYGY